MNATALAFASPAISLASTARAYGYAYTKLSPELSFLLTRGGVTIVLRPGTRLFWVNGSPESTDVAPYYRNGDLFVSKNTAHELAEIARAHPASRKPGDPAQPPPQAGQGAVTVSVEPAPGYEGVEISGTAPAGALVELRLYAQFSRDIPDVYLSSATAIAGADGRYALRQSIAPNYFRNSVVTVTAASGGGAPASATYVVGPPNPGLAAPPDILPKN